MKTYLVKYKDKNNKECTKECTFDIYDDRLDPEFLIKSYGLNENEELVSFEDKDKSKPKTTKQEEK